MSNVIIYTTEDGATRIDLRLENGTVWLSQLEIAELFQTSKQNISKHIQAIFDDQELDEKATVNQQLTVQKEGGREVSRSLTLYNLDVILAVGYRVRSVRGVQLEINAIEHREMRMADHVRELDTILSATGRKLLQDAGRVSHTQAHNKAKLEYQKYKAKTLDGVEQDYLKTLAALEKQAKTESRKK